MSKYSAEKIIKGSHELDRLQADISSVFSILRGLLEKYVDWEKRHQEGLPPIQIHIGPKVCRLIQQVSIRSNARGRVDFTFKLRDAAGTVLDSQHGLPLKMVPVVHGHLDEFIEAVAQIREEVREDLGFMMSMTEES